MLAVQPTKQLVFLKSSETRKGYDGWHIDMIQVRFLIAGFVFALQFDRSEHRMFSVRNEILISLSIETVKEGAHTF
jgi:hypothetical protein